jgi:hypothetical protein
MLTLVRTEAFRSFQRVVGDATYHINTAYIGLELIARGGAKPDDLKIRWSAPKQPQHVVAQTRSLLHTAMLGHLYGAVDNYLRGVSNVDWLPLTKEQRDILRKSVTKKGRIAYSVSERFEQIESGIEDRSKTDKLLLEVLVAWRNQSVHDDSSDDDSKTRLPSRTDIQLRNAAADLASRYGGLDAAQMLDQLYATQAPRRKEIIALASAAQNYVRTVDGVLLRQALNSDKAVERLALIRFHRALFNDGGRELKKLWGKDIDARRRKIISVLEESGFAIIEDVPHGLNTTFVEHLISSRWSDVVERLQNVR